MVPDALKSGHPLNFPGPDFGYLNSLNPVCKTGGVGLFDLPGLFYPCRRCFAVLFHQDHIPLKTHSSPVPREPAGVPSDDKCRRSCEITPAGSALKKTDHGRNQALEKSISHASAIRLMGHESSEIAPPPDQGLWESRMALRCRWTHEAPSFESPCSRGRRVASNDVPLACQTRAAGAVLVRPG